MAHALERLWPAEAPLQGLVVTRYHHTPPRPEGLRQRIEVVEASHPVPDQAGMDASERLLALTWGLSADDLVICLISGGGSSLLTMPAVGLTLADKQRINRELLACGAPIGEMNTVRKHLSRIKGGRLAAACYPAQVLTLTISDVPGDDPAVIASGPTVPDDTTCDQALALLDRYGIEIPATVRAALQDGSLETPKPGDTVFTGHQVKMMATPMQSSTVVPLGSHRKFLGLIGIGLTDTRIFSTVPIAACSWPGIGMVAGTNSFSIDVVISAIPVP
jgi:hydroxypyruvate reductase